MTTFEPVLTKNIHQLDLTRLDIYEQQGGYEGLRKALGMEPAAVVEEVLRSNLRGRGGAGFPTGRKWSFLPNDGRPRYLCCNADESEPGTFKDRMLIEHNPHQLIEGVAISAFAIQAQVAFIYLRGEFLAGYRVLQKALAEARAKGYVGKNILGSGFDLDIVVHRGAGAYICGEETALLNSLEGRRGEPRLKPPFPATHGLYQQPTVVNNVETLSCLPHILARGAEWFAGIGPEKSPGPKIFSVSGRVQRPGNYELPLGIPLRELLFEYAGGPYPGRRIKAVVPGGSSTPLFTEEKLDTPMDYDSVGQAGSMLGSAGVIVLDDTNCIVHAAMVLTRFYANESCGQCTPCREGVPWMSKVLQRIESGGGTEDDLELITSFSRQIGGKTICPFGDAALGFVISSIQAFPEEYMAHFAGQLCKGGRCA